jgi:hypothetical protein
MMTKLLNNIRIVNTGKREYIRTPVSEISYGLEPDSDLSPNFGYVYSVDVRLGCRQIVSNADLEEHGDEVLHQTRKRVGRAIAEEVYGELRKELIVLLVELRDSGNYYNSPACERVEKMLEMIEYER